MHVCPFPLPGSWDHTIDIVYLFTPPLVPPPCCCVKSFFYTTSLWKYWACYIYFLCFGAFILLCLVKSSNQVWLVFSLCLLHSASPWTVSSLCPCWMVSAWTSHYWVLEFRISSLKLISSATLVVLPHQSTMYWWLKYQTLILTILWLKFEIRCDLALTLEGCREGSFCPLALGRSPQFLSHHSNLCF